MRRRWNIDSLRTGSSWDRMGIREESEVKDENEEKEENDELPRYLWGWLSVRSSWWWSLIEPNENRRIAFLFEKEINLCRGISRWRFWEGEMEDRGMKKAQRTGGRRHKMLNRTGRSSFERYQRIWKNKKLAFGVDRPDILLWRKEFEGFLGN